MEKLNDYSGTAIDNIKITDFSYDFVCKLAKEWQVAANKEYEIVFKWIEKKLGKEEAEKFDAEFWTKVSEVIWPRIERVANIQVTDVLEAFKVGQIMLEGTMAWQPLTTLECVNGNKNHVIWTANRCLNLEYFEKADPSRIPNMCGVGGIEELSIKKLILHYFTDCEVKAIKLPPRKNKEEMACKWEIKSSGIRKQAETKTKLF